MGKSVGSSCGSPKSAARGEASFGPVFAALAEMIRFILLQNRQGRTRLAKYYVPFTDAEKHKIEHDVHRIVASRDQKFTNFVEYQGNKIVYRRYAGLYFSLCVDSTDNELVCLEIIHLFVEILDHYFSNVRARLGVQLPQGLSYYRRVSAERRASRKQQEGHLGEAERIRKNRLTGPFNRKGHKQPMAASHVYIILYLV